MDVTRVAALPNYPSTIAAPARRPEAVRASATDAVSAPLPVAKTRVTTPVERVYDGEYIQAERNRVFRASPESLRSRLFDGEPATIVDGRVYATDSMRGPSAQYRAMAAGSLPGGSERGRFIDERV